jgi:hypothetical protein
MAIISKFVTFGSVAGWAIEVQEKMGNKPMINMLENYCGGDYNKFKLWADTFFQVGHGSVQFRVAQSSTLLSDILTVYDKAFIVAIIHNGFDRWVQESSILASGGIVDKKNLPKNCWTDSGALAKKYEGWVEEGVMFFNDQIGDLQNMRLTATSKMLEDKYLKENKVMIEEKRKGPEK